MASFCAYQERSIKEVRQKLEGFNLKPEASKDLIAELIDEGFVDEKRFAEAYAGGKFRMKKWGKQKIRQGLRLHDISEDQIESSLREIPQTDYLETLRQLSYRKWKSLAESDGYTARNRLANYLQAKGFEADIIWQVIREEFEE